jgi:hypothetical protein
MNIKHSNRKWSVLSLFVLSIVTLITSSTQATWVSLTGDMIPISSVPAGGLVAGDKLFSEFEVTGIAEGGALTPNADSVLVQGGIEDDTGQYGLRFRLNWDVGSEQSINAGINFVVSILDGHDEWFIDGTNMVLSVAGATGTGVVSATETIWDGPMTTRNRLATLNTSWQAGDSDLNLRDYASFAQTKQIWTRNGITITGGDNGTAKLNEMFQMYNQIPEPVTLILLGLGSLTLLRIRKR